jgi:quercetin dioxygenase-like cupin family protein
MSDYTKRNLREVENLAPKFGMDGIEARFARVELGLEKQGMSLFRLDPDAKIPFGHRHAEQEEVYLVLSGSATVKVGDDVVELGPLDALRLAPTAVRQVQAGPDGVEFVAVGAPSVRDAEQLPELD